MQPRKYFVLLGLFFLSILLVNSLAKEEVERITITDAKQLRGIWEALYIYQETSRQERIDAHLPNLPEKEEFESHEEYKKRVNNIQEIYERRMERNLKREIRNEQKFKNMVFTFELTHIPYLVTQDSMRKYLFTSANGYSQESLTEYSDREYKARDGKVGQTNIKKSQTIDVNPVRKKVPFELSNGVNPEEYYEHREQIQVLRKKIGTTGLDVGVATYNAILRNTGYPWHGMLAYLKIPGAPIAVPPLAEWKIEENNFSLQENIAYLTFSLDRYKMEEERFPVIFPLSQFTKGEKEWVYYTKTLNEWEHYTETFKKSNVETTRQWLIKFDELPTYISLPLDKAKTVRKNEDDLILELKFQPVSAERKVISETTYYVLEVKLISAILKDSDEIIYVVADNI